MSNLTESFPIPRKYLGGVNKQRLLYDRVAILAQVAGCPPEKFWADFVKWSGTMPYSGLECADILKRDVLSGAGVPWL